MKEWIKWGIIIIVAIIALRWLAGLFSSEASVQANANLYGGWPYAAPLVGPTPIYGWVPPYPSNRGYRRRY